MDHIYLKHPTLRDLNLQGFYIDDKGLLRKPGSGGKARIFALNPKAAQHLMRAHDFIRFEPTEAELAFEYDVEARREEIIRAQTLADRAQQSSKKVKTVLLPGAKLTIDDDKRREMVDLVERLLRAGLIQTAEVAGEKFGKFVAHLLKTPHEATLWRKKLDDMKLDDKQAPPAPVGSAELVEASAPVDDQPSDEAGEGAEPEGAEDAGDEPAADEVTDAVEATGDELEGVDADLAGEMLKAALEAGTVVRRGPWYKLGKRTLGRSETEAIDMIVKNPALAARLADRADDE